MWGHILLDDRLWNPSMCSIFEIQLEGKIWINLMMIIAVAGFLKMLSARRNPEIIVAVRVENNIHTKILKPGKLSLN